MTKDRSFSGAAVVMGVASCGKTTVGEALAQRLGARFVEGDRLHSPASVARMSQGIALTDEDRWPWLDRIGEALRGQGGVIAACSALKRAYRMHIGEAAGRPVRFILLGGERALLEARISGRKGHFMPASLLDSQLRTLEVPGPDEDAITLNIASSVEQLADQAEAFLTRPQARRG